MCVTALPFVMQISRTERTHETDEDMLVGGDEGVGQATARKPLVLC